MSPSVSRLRTVIFLLAMSALSAAPAVSGESIPVTTTSARALADFRTGQRLVDNLRLTDARPHFVKAVAEDPSFALAHLYLATCAPSAKEFFTSLDRSAELASGASRGEQLWIASARAGAYGDGAGQLTALRELVESFPADERAWTLLGVAYFGQQDYVEGARNLQRATEINPDFSAAYNQLGYAYVFTGRLEEAGKTFKKYTDLLPDDPNPYDSFGEFLLGCGRFDESIAEYRKALALNSHFVNSSMGIAAGLMYQERHDAARAEVRRALDLARNDGEKRFAHFVLSVIAVDQGKFDAAVDCLGKEYAIAEKAGDGLSMAADLQAMGNVLMRADRPDEAKVKYERSLEATEGSDAATEVKDNARLAHHFNMARVALAKGNIDAARSEAAEFRAGVEKGSNPFQTRQSHELAGLIALAAKDYATAVGQLSLANQRDATILYRLALAYRGLGQMEQSRDFCKRAANFNPLPAYHFAFARRDAAKLLRELGEGAGGGTR